MSDEIASQPRIKINWLIWTLLAFGLFVVIGAYSKRMARDYPDYDRQRAQERYATLEKVRHAEQILLSPVDAQGHPTAEWVEQSKGTIRIPIEEAMAKELDTLKGQPVAIGAEIPGAVPSASTKTAPATNAAPSAPASGSAATSPSPAKPKKANK